MPNDVDISVGADTSNLAAGMAEVRNTVQSTMSDVARSLAVPLSIGGILEAFNSAIDKAHELKHATERFGLDSAEQLQLITNAAETVGISVETIARAMNKAELAGYKAAQGNQAQVDALKALNLGAEEFNKLNPADKILAVADAWNQATDRTAAYNAVAQIFGSRFGTELIPLLEKGSADIRKISEDMGVLSNAQIEAENRMYEARNTMLHKLGNLASAIFANWGYALIQAKNYAESFWYSLTGQGAKMDEADAKIQRLHDEAYGLTKPPEKKGPPVDHDPGGGTTTPPTAAGSSDEPKALTDAQRGTALEQIAKINAERDDIGKSDAEKLNELLDKRLKIQQEINALEFNPYGTDEKTEEEALLAAKKEQAEVELNIAKTKERIRSQGQQDAAQAAKDAEQAKAEKDAYLHKLSEVREAAEQEYVVEQRKLQVQILQETGHGNIVGYLEQEWAFQDKIKDLTDQINEAWAEGDQKLAEMLQKIKDEVVQQEKLNKAAQAGKFIQSQGGGAGGGGAGGAGGAGGDVSELPAGNPFGGGIDVAQAENLDPRTGAQMTDPADQAALRMNQARDMLAALTGNNLGWQEVYAATQRATQAAENIAKAGEAYQAQLLVKQETYLSAIAAGVPGYTMQGYGQIGMTGIPTSQLAGLSPVGLFQKMSANLSAQQGNLGAGYSASSVLSMAAPTSPEQAAMQQVTIGQAQVRLLQEIDQKLGGGPP